MNKVKIKEIEQAINILKESDKEYIRKVLKREKYSLEYDSEYGGWVKDGEYLVNYLFNHENTYLNPKELESTIDELMEEILPISEVAESFISYFEAKYGLEDVTEDRIYSNIVRDCEFHHFEVLGLSNEVIKQLKDKGIDIK